MSPIWVIARKEFMDVLRDRRTLVFMLLLPIVVMPLGIVGASRVAKSQARAKEIRTLTVAVDPAGRERLRLLGNEWRKSNNPKVLALAARMGLNILDINSIGEMTKLIDRIEKFKNMSDRSKIGDAALLAGFKAYREFTPEQRLVLDDAAAVQAVMERTEWADLPTAGWSEHTDGSQPVPKLPPGVELPHDLPPGLDDPAVAIAITNESKQLHAALDVPIDVFDQLDQQAVSVPITILYDSSQSLSREAYDRFKGFISALEHSQLDLRLRDAQLSPGFVEPFELRAANVASDSRQIQAMVGAFLPYLIILFCFFGAFYPSLDLTAGEKERFTLETLLLAPVSRLEIAAGKFMVVFAAAITAAVLSTTSMALTLTHGVLPEDTAAALDLEFQPLAVAMTASLLLPVAALFSSLLLGVSLLARSFKEAQSYATPMQILVIIPAVAALLPDLETDIGLAWVPLMNVSLLMKELLKGNYLWDFYVITLSTTVVLTCVVLWLTGWLFRREAVLLRS